MKRYLTIAVIFLLAFAGTASAQKVAVKTNALYWATTTPNIGMEFSMGPRWTFEIAGGYNPWLLDKETNMKVKHFLVTPEVRYWFCESFNGHFSLFYLRRKIPFHQIRVFSVFLLLSSLHKA